MKKKLANIAGWYGAGAIMSAYILVSFQIVQPQSYAYQLLNLSGALGIMCIALTKGVMQSVVLNIFWALIALIALVNIMLLK